MDEGYIKYSYELQVGQPPDPDCFPGLSRLRTALHDAHLLGIYPDGIGYGNVSALSGRGPAFIISGSGTGRERQLGREGWSLVTRCFPERNFLSCQGGIPASSESLTHDAVYRAHPGIRFVVHAHSWPLFRAQLEMGAAATPEKAAFGTPQMAEAVHDCVADQGQESGFLVMAGHEEGVIVYGDTIHTIRRILKNRMRVSGSPLALL